MENQLNPILELKQRMLLLERAHAFAGMGHFLLDPVRRTVEFSSWVREKLGLNDMPIPLDRLPEILLEEDREGFSDMLEEIIRHEDEFAFEINVMTVDGRVRTQRVSGIPEFEDTQDGRILIGMYGILQEITKERNSERDLVKARDKAQAELAARANILATVSHEIRTPLGGILGIIDQLKRERSPAERDRALTLIEDSCTVLLDTLDAIVQQARLGQDNAQLATKRFSPSALVHRVAELFRPLARRKGIGIEVNTTSKLEAIGDPARIQQVLANIVSNAVKFTRAGTVTLYVNEPGGQHEEWTFVVADTGSGMDAKRMETVFEPFGHSGDDSLGKTVGAGLGLSITRELVQSMGGEISVESVPGRGSAFTVELPLGMPVDNLDQAKSLGGNGYAILSIERASDRIQVEAAAAKAGYEIGDFKEGVPKGENGVALIIDGARLSEVSPAMLGASKLVVSIGKGTPPASTPEDLELTFVSQTSISRSLASLLAANAR